MRAAVRGFLLLCCIGIGAHSYAAPLLLISIDGLHPAYILEADRHGLKVPHLRSFTTAGTYAKGVVGVVPTVTYPSHTTLLTGVAPAQHGITSNTTFDPLGTNRDGWFWYAQDMRAPNLWQAAKRARLSTASINWPVTVGEQAIDFLLPEYWRTSTPDDLKLLRALGRPAGMIEQLEAKLGAFVDGYADNLAADEVRTKFSLALLRERKPHFTAVHLVALDGIEHHAGPFVAPVFPVLEAIDRMVGELSAAALANDASTVIAIVSDHGFIATRTAVNLRTRFVDAGLIKLAEPLEHFETPTIASWEAQVWSGAAVGAVVLRNPNDAQVRARTAKLLETLKSDPSNGIARVYGKDELKALGGFPEAEFLVEFAPGFYLGTGLRGDLLTPGTSKGTHGYMPSRPEMHAAFFVKGAGVARGRDLGVIDMRQIAPTLAHVLRVELPSAREPVLSIEAQ
jgi:predicted AlkP superfamily pyrophosphatase or phosphodiesterase